MENSVAGNIYSHNIQVRLVYGSFFYVLASSYPVFPTTHRQILDRIPHRVLKKGPDSSKLLSIIMSIIQIISIIISIICGLNSICWSIIEKKRSIGTRGQDYSEKFESFFDPLLLLTSGDSTTTLLYIYYTS